MKLSCLCYAETVPHTILIGEDEPVQRKILSALLTRKLGYKIIAAENGREVIRHVEASNIGDISVVVLDLDMPEMDGFDTLQHLRRHRPDLPVLILTGRDDTGAAVRAIKAGASDFIVKPADPEQLDVALKNAFRLSALSRELARLKRDKEGALGFHDLVGYDAGLAAAVAYARKAAASDVPVLLTGETGTGKELLARAIHGESRRVGAPFVAVHCGEAAERMLEALLFGTEKGTGTGLRTPGKFREAERGTIFLDDVHTLPADVQAKLLHALQHREIMPAGTDRPVKIHVRVIAATHRDLKAEVKAGRFSEELYFRLNVIAIAVPSLCERKRDILTLADYFLHRLSSLDGLPLKTLSADARHYLTDYLWPGNLRELEGLMHRALVLSESETITRALLKQIHETDSQGESVSDGPHIALNKPNGLPKSMDEIETEAMQKTLERYQSIPHAAEALGMAKSTFYRKLKGARE